jgi:hypothetical protein
VSEKATISDENVPELLRSGAILVEENALTDKGRRVIADIMRRAAG